MITRALAITQVTSASLSDSSGFSSRPLGIAALVSWLITASIGGYMLRTWVARGGLRRQRATGVGVPPAVVFSHPSAALVGLVVWISYLGSGWHPLAWLGVALITTAITLGVCMVTLWTPYPVRTEPKAEEKTPLATAGQSARPDVTLGTAAEGPRGAPVEHPDVFTVTDEMIARLLTESAPVRQRPRLQLLPLIPVSHGFAAIATFLLATLATVTARLGPPDPGRSSVRSHPDWAIG
jgi:hypothetical protein